MKRIISLILAVLICSVLPITAMAGGDEYYETDTLVSTSDELEKALADASDNILISSTFTWGNDEKILIIDFYGNEKTDYGSNAPKIKLMDSWTIPQDWTVICYEHLYFTEGGPGIDITVDGSFSFMDKAQFQTNYSSAWLTVNGYFATSSTSQTNLSGLNGITINGHFENLKACNVPDVTINSGGKWSITGGTVWMDGDLTLADGVYLTGNEMTISGNITARGSTTFDCTVLASKDISLSGDLNIKKFGHRGKDPVITIPAGNKVHMEDLLYWDGIRVNVAGELSFGGNYQGINNTTIHLEDRGSLILPPWIQLGSADGGSVIDGTGTLKLFAEPHPVYDTFNGYPRLFGVDSDEGISDCVSSTVTVWRNWADCVHNWVETGVVVEPTCGTQGYTERVCSVCGTTNKINIKEPSGIHNLSYAPSEWDESEVEVSCSGCGLTNEVRIYAEDKVEFKDVPVESARVYCTGNLIADEHLPQITYINNDKIGTATAFTEIGGYTIRTTFEIVACVHEIGTPATCQKPATCGKCGESIGTVKDHSWGDTLSYNETTHFFTCTVAGCGATTSSEEELYGILDPVLIEKWAICMELGMKNGGEYIPLTDHIYETGSNVCAVCGAIEGTSQESNGFKDVPTDAYYYAPVLWAVENGITTGTGDGTTFKPNESCTRGQVVTFLWRAAGKPEPAATENPFVDVKTTDYFYKAVLWAKENNITSGTGDGTTFEPNSTCNRAQIVTFLRRSKNGQPTSDNNPFKDVPAGAYYYNPVLWAVENEITTGTGDGTTFEPNSNCTRGQVITFLYRAYK